MSTIIDLHEGAFLTISDYASRKLEDGKIRSDVSQALEKSDYDTIFTILMNVSDKIISTYTSDSDVESFFFVLAQSIYKGPKSKVDDKYQKLINEVRSKKDNPILRIKILNNILHLLEPSNPLFSNTFLHVLKYGQDNNKAYDFVATRYAHRLDEQLNTWDFSLEQKREVYLVMESIFSLKSNKDKAFSFILKYLSSFADAEAENANQAASKAVISAIRNPKYFVFDDLNDLAPVKALSKSNPQLYQLLTILMSGTLADYLKFYETNKAFLESNEISHEALLTKVRLLTLCTMLSEVSGEVSYDAVAQKLQIEVQELEKWIVRGIAAKLINARLDQLRRVVSVNNTIIRQFDSKQWKNLGAQLERWKQSLVSLTAK